MGITFHKYEFSEPIKIEKFKPAKTPLVYVILIEYKYALPRPFKPIFWGESEKLLFADIQSHRARNKWKSIVDGDESKLYISVFELPESDTIERQQLVGNLIHLYGSECNY